mmetsp:Transcript_14956/g.37307  ORF Transcript_14956/g.37307 Transcript_14956/m.37307 type:complete len:212 (+) Transcript_14956:198-833(+)
MMHESHVNHSGSSYAARCGQCAVGGSAAAASLRALTLASLLSDLSPSSPSPAAPSPPALVLLALNNLIFLSISATSCCSTLPAAAPSIPSWSISSSAALSDATAALTASSAAPSCDSALPHALSRYAVPSLRPRARSPLRSAASASCPGGYSSGASVSIRASTAPVALALHCATVSSGAAARSGSSPLLPAPCADALRAASRSSKRPASAR